MDELNFEALEQIPIPEGLEERLEKKIDEWESEATLHPLHRRNRKGLSYIAIAASIALVFGIGYHFYPKLFPSAGENAEGLNIAEVDTYDDPVLAGQEADKALNLLALNLSKGMEHMERVKALSDNIENTIDEKLKVLR